MKNVIWQFLFIFVVSMCPAGRAASAPLPEQLPVQPSLHRTDCLLAPEGDTDPYQPYIQEFLFTDERAGISLYSCINWREGFLKSEGKSRDGSRRTAELIARNNALKTLLVVNFDSDATLQAYFARQPRVQMQIRNVLMQGAQIERRDGSDVMVTVPFYGISGLTSFFLDTKEIPLTPPVPRSPAAPSSEYTGILIDASDLALEPALFPQILSEDGEVLYSASQVDPSVLQTQGMIEYVTRKTPAAAAWRAGARPLIITPVLLASRAAPESMLLDTGESFCSSLPRLAQAESRRKPRRSRKNVFTVNAQQADGQIPVNVVVSVEDAKKIKRLHAEKQLDQQGQYTILVGGAIGGVEGRYPAIFFAMQQGRP